MTSRVEQLQSDLNQAVAEVEELREVLAPFALFASAIKGVRPQDPVIAYGVQSLSANAFYEARRMFPELPPIKVPGAI